MSLGAPVRRLPVRRTCCGRRWVLLGYERGRQSQPGATRFTPLNFVSYPYSHSLLALCVWGVAVRRDSTWRPSRQDAPPASRSRCSSSATGCSTTLTHRPDMPITIGGCRRVGLGLWNSVPGTLVVELAMFGDRPARLYLRATAPRDRDRIDRPLGPRRRSCSSSISPRAFGPPPPIRGRRRLVRAGDVAARDLGDTGRQAPRAYNASGTRD